MIYAYEQPILMPTRDLYDTLMMLAAVNAAKDMYEKGLQQMKDFYTKYGDFMSPFAKDMEWYGNEMGRIRDVVDQAYANGIDLFKSPEGRMLVTQLTNSISPRDYNNAKANALMGYKYLEAVQKAISDGTYSKEFEDYLLQQNGLGRFEDFSSAGGRTWNRPGPGNYQTIDDLIEPIVKNVDFSFDEALTKSKNDGNNYYTITRDRLMQAVNDNMSDILATQSGGFHYWKALLAAGGDKDLARLILNEQIANRLSDHEKTKFEADPFKLQTHEANEQIRVHAANAETDYKIEKRKKADEALLPGEKSGWNTMEDVYATTLAKAAGMEYLPQDGLSVELLQELRNLALRRQTASTALSGNALAATGMFIDPEKVGGLILGTKDGSGKGYFLDMAHVGKLHTIEEMRTSQKGWMRKGKTSQESKIEREELKEESKGVVLEIKTKLGGKSSAARLKVVGIPDDNGNNVYSFVGDDNRWHTYARVRVYAVNELGKAIAGGAGTGITQQGRDMVLEIGMYSNPNSGTPDLSVSAREHYGSYGFKDTKNLIGTEGNTGFTFAPNKIKK